MKGVRARQVLVDFSDMGERETVKSRSILDIKQKTDKALAKSGGSMVGHNFMAVTWLRNGGVLLDLDSKEAIEWFCSSEVIRRAFASKFYSSALIRS